VVEFRGYRREDAQDKKAAMETHWVPGVDNLGTFGCGEFAELCDVDGLCANRPFLRPAMDLELVVVSRLRKGMPDCVTCRRRTAIRTVFADKTRST